MTYSANNQIFSLANNQVFSTLTVYDGSISISGVFQGVDFGYTSGGTIPDGSTLNTIDRFPFATDASASAFNTVAVSLTSSSAAGQSSSENAYTAGGYSPASTRNWIRKFSFAMNLDNIIIGDLTEEKLNVTGQSSDAYGYVSGGGVIPTVINTIEKFPFATDSNALSIGSLTEEKSNAAGQSSTTHGYTSGGVNGRVVSETNLNIIDKFPFSSDASASDVGDLTVARTRGTGQSSSTHGYTSGGLNTEPPDVQYNTIDKFSFATDESATDVGDLTQIRYSATGQSSTVSGYTSGGFYQPPSAPTLVYNTIDKFSFATDESASDVGDLTQARSSATGHQI